MTMNATAPVSAVAPTEAPERKDLVERSAQGRRITELHEASTPAPAHGILVPTGLDEDEGHQERVCVGIAPHDPAYERMPALHAGCVNRIDTLVVGRGHERKARRLNLVSRSRGREDDPESRSGTHSYQHKPTHSFALPRPIRPKLATNGRAALRALRPEFQGHRWGSRWMSPRHQSPAAEA
jgi:hypothetical protein